jgi:triacylglycerol esterase/lipase EstA (alpha/beta hydrolase family)
MGGKRGDFLPMSLYLRLMGRTRSYRINFDAGQSIEEMAEALANFIRDVINATGEKHVEIVAHSLGGIVSRLSINEHAIDSHVKTLITLGTPHKGTYPARYANTANIRDIRPDSVLIRRLNGKSLPGNIRTVTFWSKNDLFVLPAESAALEGSEQIDASPFTHYSYLIDPESWIKVGRILAQ